jgi:hypothetical protein
LQPHRVEHWKLSKDPQFIEKVHDICGLYLNPPERAVVLAVDEKSQIQALDRTQPGLPMKPQSRKGRAGAGAVSPGWRMDDWASSSSSLFRGDGMGAEKSTGNNPGSLP